MTFIRRAKCQAQLRGHQNYLNLSDRKKKDNLFKQFKSVFVTFGKLARFLFLVFIKHVIVAELTRVEGWDRFMNTF